MLKGIISGSPEPVELLAAVGTTSAGAPTVSGRFVYVSADVGNTAVNLPSVQPGAWFYISTDGGATARLFAIGGDGLVVGGVMYDAVTPYQIVAGKAVLVMTTGQDALYYGVALG